METGKMHFAQLETKLFGDGLWIDSEFTTGDAKTGFFRIRLVTCVNGDRYRFTYRRQEHKYFVHWGIDNIEKLTN